MSMRLPSSVSTSFSKLVSIVKADVAQSVEYAEQTYLRKLGDSCKEDTLDAIAVVF